MWNVISITDFTNINFDNSNKKRIIKYIIIIYNNNKKYLYIFTSNKDKISTSEETFEAPIPFGNDKTLTKQFKIKSSDNIAFNFEISKGKDQIIFIAIDDIQGNIYKNAAQLTDFTKEKRYNYFRQFETIDDLFNDYIGLIKDTEITIAIKDNNVSIGLQFETRAKKDEIIFELRGKKKILIKS